MLPLLYKTNARQHCWHFRIPQISPFFKKRIFVALPISQRNFLFFVQCLNACCSTAEHFCKLFWASIWIFHGIICDNNFSCKWKEKNSFLLSCSSAAIVKTRMFCLSFYFTVVKISTVICEYKFKQWFECWNISFETTFKHSTVLKNGFQQRRNDFQTNDKLFPNVTDESNSFSLNSNARGYPVYVNIWNPADGQALVCTSKNQ